MRLHGVTEPEDYISKAMQGKSTQKMTPVKSENRTEEVSCVLQIWRGKVKLSCHMAWRHLGGKKEWLWKA
jgi:hypothetical protein